MNLAHNIADLKGLGPKSATQLAQIGILTVEDIMQTDAYEIYARFKKHGSNTSLNMLYAIMGAQENIHWQSIAKNRKMEILMRLDDMNHKKINHKKINQNRTRLTPK